MLRPHLFLCLLLLFLPSPRTLADDQEASSTESRLRDALRNTMLQLQDAQGQVATLQATQTQSDQQNAALKAQVDSLNTQIKALNDKALADQSISEKKLADLTQQNQQLIDEMVDTLSIQINLLNKPGTDAKGTLDKSIADMKTKNPDLTKALDQYGTDIQLWKTGYDQYVQLANNTEAARARLAAEAAILQRTVEDREMKNLQLYDTANEILTRYQNFGLGDALEAREPFVGLTRARLQELVQDYKDKIQSEKVKMGQPPVLIGQGPAAAPAVSAAHPASASIP
jgi:chromosome segregation ATPase